MPCLKFKDLKIPPSANELYLLSQKPRGKRFKTAKYTNWLKKTGWECLVQLKGQNEMRVPDDVTFQITIYAKIDRKRDLDNIIKPILDLFQNIGIITDDRCCDIINCERKSSYDHAEKNTCSIQFWW